jgi:hypothetical protein
MMTVTEVTVHVGHAYNLIHQVHLGSQNQRDVPGAIGMSRLNFVGL